MTDKACGGPAMTRHQAQRWCCAHLSERRLTALVGAQPEASAAGVSPTGFRKPLLHGLLGALGLASPGSSLFWEEPRDIMDDPLTRRKSSEAVLLSVRGTVFFNRAAKPGEGKHCPQLHCMWCLEGGAEQWGLRQASWCPV